MINNDTSRKQECLLPETIEHYKKLGYALIPLTDKPHIVKKVFVGIGNDKPKWRYPSGVQVYSASQLNRFARVAFECSRR